MAVSDSLTPLPVLETTPLGWRTVWRHMPGMPDVGKRSAQPRPLAGEVLRLENRPAGFAFCIPQRRAVFSKNIKQGI